MNTVKTKDDGLISISSTDELRVSNTCLLVNEKPFIVEHPSTEFIDSVETDDKVRVLKYVSESEGVKSIPASEVKGYWA